MELGFFLLFTGGGEEDALENESIAGKLQIVTPLIITMFVLQY